MNTDLFLLIPLEQNWVENKFQIIGAEDKQNTHAENILQYFFISLHKIYIDAIAKIDADKFVILQKILILELWLMHYNYDWCTIHYFDKDNFR